MFALVSYVVRRVRRRRERNDHITYKIQVDSSNPLSFTAELKYQALAYGFMQDLFRDNLHPEVAMFEGLFNSARVRTETIAAVSRTLL